MAYVGSEDACLIGLIEFGGKSGLLRGSIAITANFDLAA
jgi:hypothetical protein